MVTKTQLLVHFVRNESIIQVNMSKVNISIHFFVSILISYDNGEHIVFLMAILIKYIIFKLEFEFTFLSVGAKTNEACHS